MTSSTTGEVETTLEVHLRARRDQGAKLLVPYVMGGLDDEWTDLLRAFADAGADAIEVGLPFSDPMMDGPVVQEASAVALARGATPLSVLDELSRVDAGIPLVAMTYYNLCYHAGHERFAHWLTESRGVGHHPGRPAPRGGRPVGGGGRRGRHRHRHAGCAHRFGRAVAPRLRTLPGLRVRRVPAGGDGGAARRWRARR